MQNLIVSSSHPKKVSKETGEINILFFNYIENTNIQVM
jgi:hypothetical protein